MARRTERLPSGVALPAAAVAGVLAGLALVPVAAGLPPVPVVVPVLVGVLIAAGTVAGVARPEGLVVAAVALSPVVRIEPAPYDLLLVGAAAAWFVAGRPPGRLPPVPVVAPLAVYCLISLLSLQNAHVTFGPVRYEAITLYMILTAIWLGGILVEGSLARRIVVVWIVVGAVASAASIVALQLGAPAILIYEGGSRIQGLFKDPNVFGPYLVPPALFLLEDLARPRLVPRWPLGVRVALLTVLVAGVAFSFSRAAWLNLAAGMFAIVCLLAVRRGGARAALRVVALGAAGLAATFVALSLTGALAFLQSRTRFQQYDSERFGAQQAAIELMTRHLFGFGPGQADSVVGISTHSLFARLLLEQGVFGAGAMTVALLATLVFAVRAALADVAIDGLGAVGVAAAFGGVLANSPFVDTLHWRHLWLLAALAWAMDGARRLGSRTRPGEPARVTAPPGG